MSKISKSEYIKKYLTVSDCEGKKKKRTRKKPGRNVSGSNRFKIVDADAAVPLPEEAINPFSEEEIEEDEVGPVIEITEKVTSDELKLLGKFNTDSWQSLGPRRQRNDSHSSSSEEEDASPARKRSRHDSESSDDNSPRRQRNDTDSDFSPDRSDKNFDTPPRKKPSAVKNLSPVRGRKSDDDSDASPSRNRVENDSDVSPPRNRADNDSDASPPRNRARARRRRSVTPEIVESSSGKLKKTLSGKSAGLQSAKQLREESDKLKKREMKAFATIDDTVSGRNAETVFRDRGTGKRRDIKQEQQLTEEQIRKQEELEAKYQRWNKGVKQVESRKARLDEMVKEASKPLARYEGDADLEEHLKQQEMKEDPMLEYMRQKKTKKAIKAGVSQFPKYSGPPPPQNRFHIMPGYRWDGIDRSNGFEKKLFTTTNSKKAEEEEYYKWTMGTYE